MKLKQPLSYRDFQSLFMLALEFPWICNREEAMLELWETTGSDENQKRLIEYLIHQFMYVDSDMSLEFAKQIALQITQEWELRPYNTYITAACDHSHPDGSQQMVQKIKNHFPYGWREYDFVNSLPEAVYKLHSNDCLVICDDFIGTGDTMTRKIDYAEKVIKKMDYRMFEYMWLHLQQWHFRNKQYLGGNALFLLVVYCLKAYLRH